MRNKKCIAQLVRRQIKDLIKKKKSGGSNHTGGEEEKEVHVLSRV